MAAPASDSIQSNHLSSKTFRGANALAQIAVAQIVAEIVPSTKTAQHMKMTSVTRENGLLRVMRPRINSAASRGAIVFPNE